MGTKRAEIADFFKLVNSDEFGNLFLINKVYLSDFIGHEEERALF